MSSLSHSMRPLQQTWCMAQTFEQLLFTTGSRTVLTRFNGRAGGNVPLAAAADHARAAEALPVRGPAANGAAPRGAAGGLGGAPGSGGRPGRGRGRLGEGGGWGGGQGGGGGDGWADARGPHPGPAGEGAGSGRGHGPGSAPRPAEGGGDGSGRGRGSYAHKDKHKAAVGNHHRKDRALKKAGGGFG